MSGVGRDNASRAGLVVFAHTPPPHHGQSVMVGHLLDALRDQGVADRFPRPVFHVNARVSDGLSDVGGMAPGKLFRLLGHCLRAISLRLRAGARTLYYIPAPPKPSAILRDGVAMALLRPFFPELVLHWHAVGLGAWASGAVGVFGGPRERLEAGLRTCLRRGLGSADLALVLAEGNRGDAQAFLPRRVEILPNGIPDPCPSPDLGARKDRMARIAGWLAAGCPRSPGNRIRLAYLGHCTEAKGLFTALDGVLEAARRAGGIRLRLEVAGDFVDPRERRRAEDLLGALRLAGVEVNLRPFLQAGEKAGLFADTDVFLFPSRSESFGLVAVEALAWGIPVVASDIPGLRAVLGELPCPRIPVADANALASAILNPATYSDPAALRARYEREFTLELFGRRIRALLS